MWVLWLVLALLLGVGIYDLIQRRHAILRNFPIIGHLRYLFEAIGPELRQYIVTSNNEELPFSRDERRWVYASSKKENNYFGFGTDNDLEAAAGYLIIKHAAFPLPNPHEGDAGYDPDFKIPCAKILGGPRDRKRAFRPGSFVNISGMSFGSLSGPATVAINRGAGIAGCLHNTGEGGVAPHHLHGGNLIWQIGTGYFGCRNDDGTFCLEKLVETCAQHPVRALEIKLSQGAKPGIGGILPAAKITEEISRIRGIPMGRDCRSPNSHSSFHDVDSMLDFVERIADATGLPVGIKSAIGELGFWQQLAAAMESGERGVDFITVDGGEGGTGAAPLVFSDHVALPVKLALSRVFRVFCEQGIQQRVVFVASGRLGFPHSALLAAALGADLVHVAREAMLAIGCIQAQRCHTDHCPTGVATQNRWLVRGLDPSHKAGRLANYVITLRKEILALCRACAVPHPACITGDHFEILDGHHGGRTLNEIFGLTDGWVLPAPEDIARTKQLMEAGGAVAAR